MTVREALQKTAIIQIPSAPLPVEETCSSELLRLVQPGAKVISEKAAPDQQAVFRIAVDKNADFPIEQVRSDAQKENHWAYFRIDSQGAGELIVSHSALLYAYLTRLIEDWIEMPVSSFERGTYFTSAFRWHRPLYDYLITQTWRTTKYVDQEEHIRQLARAGYTHVEVNGMAGNMPLEQAIPGEFYSQFYSYCLALDQFVYTDLNKGIYPVEYLTANLNLLKQYASLGRKYGLEPGILCFEPRTVPEKFFRKYPTLRGARVDHPFRSRLPRYNLTIAHPLVEKHYREMIRKLLQEVPDLSYMSVWSNDSGAGFEYTSSLYVGRNGGPYLIREWKTHEQIAEVAGKNVVRFMKILREAASETNPEFRVALKFEPFKVEHDVIINHLEKYLDIEVPSLLVRGYDLPYTHHRYDDVSGVAGSIHHVNMEKQERKLIKKHKENGVESHLVYSHGNGYNLEPLLGLPFPRLNHQKLRAMKESGVEYAANLGGFTPTQLAPYHINQEVFRDFMLDPKSDVEQSITRKAREWAGERADQLIEVWNHAEEGIRGLPPLPLYTVFGAVWLRIWVRPIIPNLHAIPEQDRRYYEDFMVSSSNNPNLVDLGRDVLFDLITQEYGDKFVRRVDQNVFWQLDKAIEMADQQINDDSLEENIRQVFVDQRDRLRAFHSWVGTLRSVAAWVNGVYGYLEADDQATKQKWRHYLDDMMDKEIQNIKALLQLWQSSDVHFMVVSETGETSYIYGENFGDLLQKKLRLMAEYRHVEPWIDKEIMWKV